VTDQNSDGTYQQGIVGTCVECAGQMVEVWRSSGDGRGILGLECQDCGETGRIEYIIREENPWQNPSVQESVTDTTVNSINWIDCPRCYGHGWVEDPICDLRRAMNGREHPCTNCHTEGTVPRVVETDGGHSRDGTEQPATDDAHSGATVRYVENPYPIGSDVLDVPCGRCNTAIHIFEPATRIILSGELTGDVLLCADCSDEYYEWFVNTGTEESNDAH